MNIYLNMILSFIFTFLLLIFIINYQKKRMIGQYEREEGLVSHKVKKNTPIFGGVAFIFSIFISITILLINKEIDILKYLMIVFPMLSFGLIGFVDDYFILKKKHNSGISANVKLFLQIIISILFFVLYLLLKFDTSIDFIIFKIDIKFMYGIFILLSFSGFTNAANLTDGMDGLLAGVLSIILIGVFLVSKTNLEQQIVAIIFSSLCAFLYFNLPKARVFMGNVGSLALGALFVSIMVLFKQEMLMFIFGLIFIIEAFSVVLQVSYFKITKGKRIFKMAPIHHHFEIILGSEIKTLFLFYLATIFTVVMGLLIIL